MKKRAKVTFQRPSRADIAECARRLRYMNPVNVAKDFPSKRERAAMGAVFKWLSLNGIVARALKRGHYATHMRPGKWHHDPFDAVVVDKAALDRAEKLLVPAEK